MRFYFFLAILLVAAIIGQMGRADMAPCSSEEAELTRTDGQLADSMTLRLSLKSQLETEMVTRSERLTPILKDASENMDLAGKSSLSDQQLYELIASHKSITEQILNDKSSLDKIEPLIAAALLRPPVRPFSKCVFEVAQSLRNEALLQSGEVFRRLEGQRAWVEQIKIWRDDLSVESRVLTQALQHLPQFSEILRQRLVSSSSHLTEFKVKIRDAEKQLELSMVNEGRLKNQIDQVERRITALKAALPELRARLNRCTHRAQFGN